MGAVNQALDPPAPLPAWAVWLMRLLWAPLRWFIGHDVFVCYARADARRYALALVQWLGDEPRGFSCAVDSLHSVPGARTPLQVLLWSCLSRARIIIASPAALGSVEVLREVRAFSAWPATTLVLAPPDLTLADARWGAWLRGVEPIREPGAVAAFSTGDISSPVQQALGASLVFMRRERRLALGAGFAVLVFALAFGAAWQQGRQARESRILAQAAKTEAETASRVAAEQGAMAASQASRAARAAERAAQAGRQASAAEQAASSALEQAAQAERQAQRALRAARSRNLAGLSTRVAPESQLQALRLAAQALELDDNPDTRLVAVQALGVEPRLERILAPPGRQVDEVAIGPGGLTVALLTMPQHKDAGTRDPVGKRLEIHHLGQTTRLLRQWTVAVREYGGELALGGRSVLVLSDRAVLALALDGETSQRIDCEGTPGNLQRVGTDRFVFIEYFDGSARRVEVRHEGARFEVLRHRLHRHDRYAFEDLGSLSDRLVTFQAGVIRVSDAVAGQRWELKPPDGVFLKASDSEAPLHPIRLYAGGTRLAVSMLRLFNGRHPYVAFYALEAGGRMEHLGDVAGVIEQAGEVSAHVLLLDPQQRMRLLRADQLLSEQPSDSQAFSTGMRRAAWSGVGAGADGRVAALLQGAAVVWRTQERDEWQRTPIESESSVCSAQALTSRAFVVRDASLGRAQTLRREGPAGTFASSRMPAGDLVALARWGAGPELLALHPDGRMSVGTPPQWRGLPARLGLNLVPDRYPPLLAGGPQGLAVARYARPWSQVMLWPRADAAPWIERFAAPVMSLAFIPGTSLLLVGLEAEYLSGAGFELIDLRTRVRTRPTYAGARVDHGGLVTVSRDGQRLALVQRTDHSERAPVSMWRLQLGADQTVKLQLSWDSSTYDYFGDRGLPSDLAFSPDDQLLLVGYAATNRARNPAGGVDLFDVRSGQRWPALVDPTRFSEVSAAGFAPDGSSIHVVDGCQLHVRDWTASALKRGLCRIFDADPQRAGSRPLQGDEDPSGTGCAAFRSAPAGTDTIHLRAIPRPRP